MSMNPISAEKFSFAMQKLAPNATHIAVAVSGGGDSLALALLMHDWAQERGGKILALTVDHALRPGSGDEALHVQNLLRERGIEHKILKWEGDKPATHIQEEARRARYELLLAECHAQNISTLALAHNAEDQIETFWMRLAHGSGLDGLAAMAAARLLLPLPSGEGRGEGARVKNKYQNPDAGTLSPTPLPTGEGVTLIRPVLSFTREQLRDTCKAYGVEWASDPSNENEKFLRVRLRKFEELLASEGLTPQRLAQTVQKLEYAREALEEMAARARAGCATLHDEGYATLNISEWKNWPRDIRLRVLSSLLQSVCPRPYAAGFDALEQLGDDIHGETFTGGTLAGCDIFPAGVVVVLCREAARMEPRTAAAPQILWDGRFSITGIPAGCAVGGLGEEGLHELRKKAAPHDPALQKLEKLPFKVKKTLPALWRGPNLVFVPHLGWAAGPGFSDVAVKVV